MNTKHSAPPASSDPAAEVKAAGLRYVTDTQPGLRREVSDGGFRYFGPNGALVDDAKTLARIQSLAIPPAYTDVWICTAPNGYLQATGRDAKGRKQYRYHPHWRETRDETKYDHMTAFGAALPNIRAQVARDLSRPGLPRPKVLATVVQLLETTLIRIGNAQYAKENKHYGLTTLQNEHVDVDGSIVHFHFVGKSGKEHTVDLKDRHLAKIVARLRDLPGHEVFQYLDEAGNRQSIDSADVNAYLHEIAGQEFTAKDFRTWAGTVLAALALLECEAFDSPTQAKKNITEVIKTVSQRLGNTPAICRKCYVHPAVFESYLAGTMRKSLTPHTKPENTDSPHSLRPEETAVLALLARRLAEGAATHKPEEVTSPCQQYSVFTV